MVVGALERCSDTPVMRYEDCPPGLRARQPADPLRGAHRPPHGNGWSRRGGARALPARHGAAERRCDERRVPAGATRRVARSGAGARRRDGGVRSAHPAVLAGLALGPADRLLLAVGNLYPVKGHHDLVVALAQLAARHPTLHAAIAGRGAVEPLLRQEAAARGVTHRLHLLGLRGDIGNLLASADVFVLPSHSEGLPLALLEAMFTARPIVATRVGEVPTVLAEGNAGLLVDPGSPDQLTLAIDRLLGDPSLARALGARARARAEAEFHVSRMVARYADLYRAALDRAS